ncbi:MAG: hypothetical protein AAFS10_22825, partial [Myxococcota bacterium]
MMLKHLRHQGAVVTALGKVALRVLRQKQFGASKDTAPPQTPGPWLEETIAPRPSQLVHDYVRHVGGNPRAYRAIVPPHLYPQWGFPLLSQTLNGLDYPLDRVLNGGCSFEVNAPLSSGAPLHLKARLDSIDD